MNTKTEEQFRTYHSRNVCHAMPFEPNAWYAVRMLIYDGGYEWGLIRRGVQISELHRFVDFSMDTGLVHFFMWIVRLTDEEAQELGL